MADVLEPLVLPRSEPSEPKASILLVDDNPANLLSLRAILEEEDRVQRRGRVAVGCALSRRSGPALATSDGF